MDNIRFSVHIPVYNAQKFLVNCVESVLTQSYGNFELILTDDSSTDGSGEICDSFTDDRIRVFHNKNQGPLLTRVFSVSQARGEYSIFIDSDDTVDDGYFEYLNEVISAENCDMIVCSFKKVTNTSVKKGSVPWKEKKVLTGDDRNYFYKEFMLNAYMNPICFKVIRTELLKQDDTNFTDFANFRNAEDKLQSLYPVFNSEKIVLIPEGFYNYYENDKSITHTININKYKSILRISEKSYEYFENSSIFTDENKALYAVYFIRNIMRCVWDVACSGISKTEKITIFKDIAEDSIFRRIVKDFKSRSSDQKTESIFMLFKLRRYRAIIFTASLLNKR